MLNPLMFISLKIECLTLLFRYKQYFIFVFILFLVWICCTRKLNCHIRPYNLYDVYVTSITWNVGNCTLNAIEHITDNMTSEPNSRNPNFECLDYWTLKFMYFVFLRSAIWFRKRKMKELKKNVQKASRVTHPNIKRNIWFSKEIQRSKIHHISIFESSLNWSGPHPFLKIFKINRHSRNSAQYNGLFLFICSCHVFLKEVSSRKLKHLSFNADIKSLINSFWIDFKSQLTKQIWSHVTPEIWCCF